MDRSKKPKRPKKSNGLAGNLDMQNSALQKILKALKNSINPNSGKGKKHIFSFMGLLFILLICIYQSQGQSIDHTVVASAGNSSVQAGCTLQWTVGETVVSSWNKEGTCISQGFHQGANLTTGVKRLQEGSIHVYPNPCSSSLTINLPASQLPKTAIIYTPTGQVAQELIIKVSPSTFQLGHFKPGMYFIKIQDRKNYQSIKIIKK